MAHARADNRAFTSFDANGEDFKVSEGADRDRPSKRKRNKPTLSCGECVERKTKCDRGRPVCLGCIRRKTECHYHRKVYPDKNSHNRRASEQSSTSGLETASARKGSKDEFTKAQQSVDSLTTSFASLESASSPAQALLSNIPYSVPKASNIYGIGSEHPFNNYWTLTGGLGEVVSVLPSKPQADILVARFFHAVDPVYPLVHQAAFYLSYNAFWELSFADKAKVDSSFLALLLVMLAMGTQFLRLPGDPVTTQQNQSSGAEFYASACHQALRLGAYLNRASVQTLQAMVLMTYFLMNANHASDGWAFAGIIIRQAYAIGLNRDQSLLFDPTLTWIEREERKRLWQGVVCQDAFMSVILRLPPGATHADIDRPVPRTSLDDMGGFENTPPGTDSTASSPEAPRQPPPPPIGLPESSFECVSDIGYVKGLYSLARLVQETISSPRSLSLPVATTPAARAALLARFDAIRAAFHEPFRAWSEHTAAELCHRGGDAGQRLARQIFILNSNYWHCVMLVQLEGSEQAEAAGLQLQDPEMLVAVDGSLSSAHEAIKAFFVMHALLEDDAGTWWVMAHRAFTQALSMANILKQYAPVPFKDEIPPDLESLGRLPALLSRARIDVMKMIAVLKNIAAQDEISRTRVEVLEGMCELN